MLRSLSRFRIFSGKVRFPLVQSVGPHYLSTNSNHEVPLTQTTMPNLKRGDFAHLNDSDLTTFTQLLDNNRVLTDEADLQGYNIDWMRSCRGSSKVVLKPRNTEEVSAILRHCSSRNLAVVPQGGNTGLVGGSVPVFDEVVLSMQLMNKVIEINDISGIVVCQAGVVLEALDNQVSGHGLCVPLDLGAKGSCHIGGNVSTNAGGLRLLRYGSLHGSVLGLEVVTANGEVLDCLSCLRKDNTGYDLKQIFIGSEGTLGVITKISLLCPPRPAAVNVAFLGCDNFDQILKTFTLSRRKLSEVLSAFEFMDNDSMRCVQENLGLKNPIGEHPFYLLVETSGASQTHDQAKLEGFLEAAMADDLVLDGVVAQDSVQAKSIMEVRECVAEAVVKEHGYLFLDMSLSMRDLPLLKAAVVEQASKLGIPEMMPSVFAHIGDGNLHLNLTSKRYDSTVLRQLEPFIYEWIRERHGSISAEHGLGIKKAPYIYYTKSRSAVDYMRQIKKMFDPQGILNPYKVLPPI